MSGWQCEPLNPKPPKPSTFEHVRFTRADVGAKWVGNNRKRFRSSPNHSRSVLADGLSSGLGQPETFQVVPNHSRSVLADDPVERFGTT